MKIEAVWLLADPDQVAEVNRDDIPELIGTLATLQALLLARLSDAPERPLTPPNAPDRLLTVEEVAEALGVDTRWVYRKHEAGKLPFARKLGPNTLRFSERGLWKYVERRAA